jgi:RNA-directed DNA polymerase
MKKFDKQYKNIIEIDNLLLAWQEFLWGKRNKKDVEEFRARLMDNIFNLHQDLKNKSYTHGEYKAFKISDPKPRDIHKASVRDRLLHRAIYRILYQYFDKKFIYDSYSCRINKGTHRAIKRFETFSRKVSKNNTKICWVLKCDIRKFFANIDHVILKQILTRYIQDTDTLSLLGNIISSFHTKSTTNSAMAEFVVSNKRGLPLGNLTSQLLVNIYMNEFDQYIKHKLKVKYYIRYADDFIILSEDNKCLENLVPVISEFLSQHLKLQLNPDKLYIKTLFSGVDFLGWINFPNHRALRTSTKRRMFKNIENNSKNEVIQSYLGLLSHGNGHKLEEIIKSLYFI